MSGDIEQPEQRGEPERLIRSGGISLLDEIDVALYAIDEAGLCLRLNLACERLLGYTEAESLGKNMHALVHSFHADGTPFEEKDCRLMQARTRRESLRDLQETMWAADGTAVEVECSTSPVTLPDGTVCTVVTMKDVRSRIAAEKARVVLEQEQEAVRQTAAAARAASELAVQEIERQRRLQESVERAAADQIRKQQQMLGVIASSAPVGIAVMDGEARYRWTNEAYARTMDPAFAGSVLEGRSYFATVAPGNLEQMRAIVEEVQRTGTTFLADNFAMEGVGRGTTYWRWSLSRLDNGDLLSTGIEVTEQVNARREVDSVYANAPIALGLVDAETLSYRRVNVCYAELMGVTPEEMLGKVVGTFSRSPDSGGLLEHATKGRSSHNALVRLEILANPGVERFVLVNAVPNHTATGVVETISLALTDVTAQKRAEDALVKADKLAAVGRLAASISHEINNPLEAVTNLLYLVHQDPTLSDESCEYIKQAEAELQRVSQIASQTLRFQRQAVKAVSTTAKQLIDPVIAMYQGRLKHTRIEVAVDYRGNEETMVVFEGDVRQILNNLLGNAIDATPGGGTITVRARPARCVHTRRRGTRISISDSGHGMSAETAAHIFEPFFTTKGSGGSGLGLWISHTLAQRHHGQLRVRSRQREGHSGTVFSLFLPNVTEQEQLSR